MRAVEIAAGVRAGRLRARDITERTLAAIETEAPQLNAVTRLLAERARREAAEVDALVDQGKDPGPLAGVPYGVKDLFAVEGLPNTAGSGLYADAPPEASDARAITLLREAGAILCATLNMDEFAYGFATINARHGTTRNPHDMSRLAGGSSGGSAAIVAAGLLPFSLGSDTNGSVRVPASLTGIYGLKPSHGDLPLEGVFPFAETFDDCGPFTSCVADMVCVWEALSGKSAAQNTSTELRIARLGGRFADNCDPAQAAAMEAIAPGAPVIELPDIARARSAAFLITACEGGRLHRAALAENPMAFDPATRDRLLAGALLPQGIYAAAQAFRTEFRERVLKLIRDFDVLLAPAAPCVAPLVDDPTITIDGRSVPARADLGIHTQPITFTGLPSLAVPLHRPGQLPLGLQLIGKPHGEPALFRFAVMLEQRNIIQSQPPQIAFQGEAAI